MQGSTVKNNLAIVRDWRGLFRILVQSKPVRIDAHRTGNTLVASRTIPVAVEINNDDLFARVQLLLKLFWGDSRHSKFAQKAAPSNQFEADVYRQCRQYKKD